MSRNKRPAPDDFMIFPVDPKKTVVAVTIQYQNAEFITADNEEEYHSKMSSIKRKYGRDCIEIKQIVGVIIPLSTECIS